MLHDEETNNKLLVLFLLDKLEIAMAEDLVLDMCSIENVWMPYLCCTQILGYLKQESFITYTKATKDEARLLALTEKGRSCLAAFFNDIPQSQRDDVTEFVKQKRIEYRKKQELTADYNMNEDGTYTVHLKIMEVANPLVDLKLTVGTKAKAQDINNKWQSLATDVYRGLCDLLLD